VSTTEQQVASLLAAAVSQLELALRESQGPADQLGAAIASISAGVDANMSKLELKREVSQCIEALQFYDRMTQHLSHIQNFISGMTAAIDSAMRGEEDQMAWDQLRVRLRQRLISDPQRELLDLLVAPTQGHPAASRAAQERHADPGSIELF